MDKEDGGRPTRRLRLMLLLRASAVVFEGDGVLMSVKDDDNDGGIGCLAFAGVVSISVGVGLLLGGAYGWLLFGALCLALVFLVWVSE